MLLDENSSTRIGGSALIYGSQQTGRAQAGMDGAVLGTLAGCSPHCSGSHPAHPEGRAGGPCEAGGAQARGAGAEPRPPEPPVTSVRRVPRPSQHDGTAEMCGARGVAGSPQAGCWVLAEQTLGQADWGDTKPLVSHPGAEHSPRPSQVTPISVFIVAKELLQPDAVSQPGWRRVTFSLCAMPANAWQFKRAE